MITNRTTHTQGDLGGRGRFVVLGARGKTGGRVASRLRDRGHAVVEASRSTTPTFDWGDPSTWAPALEGATGLYATYFPDLAAPGATDAVAALAQVARASGVERAVLLSGRGEPAARQGEDAFLGGFPGADIVRCAWFDQNFTEGIFAPAVAAGAISLPAPPEAVEPFVDAEDIADCAVELLTRPASPGGVHELTGPAALTLADAAAVLGAARALPVRYLETDVPGFARVLEEEGLSQDEALGLAHVFADTLDGRNAHTTSTVEDLLGRAPRSLADFAADAHRAGTLPMPLAMSR